MTKHKYPKSAIRDRSTSGGSHARRLRTSRSSSFSRYVRSMFVDLHVLRFVLLLVGLRAFFAFALYVAEGQSADPVIGTYAEALYWSVAAFSTAGIAESPTSPLSMLVGGLWIVTGSVIFFGIIVATVTGYFMRPLQRPVHHLVETIEYNLEHLNELSVEELDLLKETTDSLILHVERLKERQARE